MNVIIVGAGGTARELLAGLSDHWDITAVDRHEDRLERATKVRDIETIVGDGSSRVILQRAGLDAADAVLAVSDDDDVNLEVCRLAVEAGVAEIAAVARDPERLQEYRDLDVPAFSRARLTARRLEMQVEPRRVTRAAFADGRAEAIEFKITPDAPVVNRALRDLASERWLVAAVLRDGSLIVPHGNTVLRANDLVTVVGAAADYSAIVELFTSGQARFPLDFGRTILTVCDDPAQVDGHVSEAAALVHSSAAETLMVIHDDPAAHPDQEDRHRIDEIVRRLGGLAAGIDLQTRPAHAPSKDLASVATAEGAGVVVLPTPSNRSHGSMTRPRYATTLLKQTGAPVLMARGTHPYRCVMAPARDSPAGMAGERAAIDIAALGTTGLRAVAIVPPPYLGGAGSSDVARRSIARFREEAAVHGLSLEGEIVEGNPVREIAAATDGVELVVIGVQARSRSSRAFARHLARRLDVSLMLIPEAVATS
jgi:Trk K+ transport system NAD-binding subunit